MSRSLKSFARAELDKLQVRFPYLDPEALGDPQQTNGIFNRNEWTADGPATDLAKVSGRTTSKSIRQFTSLSG